jgi:hypothetical protein
MSDCTDEGWFYRYASCSNDQNLVVAEPLPGQAVRSVRAVGTDHQGRRCGSVRAGGTDHQGRRY